MYTAFCEPPQHPPPSYIIDWVFFSIQHYFSFYFHLFPPSRWEATGPGFVCYVVINPCVLSANRVDLGLFFISYILLPLPPAHTPTCINGEGSSNSFTAPVTVWGNFLLYIAVIIHHKKTQKAIYAHTNPYQVYPNLYRVNPEFLSNGTTPIQLKVNGGKGK